MSIFMDKVIYDSGKCADSNFDVGGLIDRTITEVVVPAGVTSIGASAFLGCSILKKAVLPQSLLRIEDNAFNTCGLTDIVIPDSVAFIGRSVFNTCRKLKSVVLPASVKVLDISLFYYCTALETISIPKGVTTIGANCFNACKAIDNIYIPASVSAINVAALAGTTNLKTIYTDVGNSARLRGMLTSQIITNTSVNIIER